MTANIIKVSTHSRLKAAGIQAFCHERRAVRFNTQPPEGGWTVDADSNLLDEVFQHTAA